MYFILMLYLFNILKYVYIISIYFYYVYIKYLYIAYKFDSLITEKPIFTFFILTHPYGISHKNRRALTIRGPLVFF